MASNRNPTLAASKIALLYALLSVLWILFSDQLLSMTAATVEALTMMQMVDGEGTFSYTPLPPSLTSSPGAGL